MDKEKASKKAAAQIGKPEVKKSSIDVTLKDGKSPAKSFPDASDLAKKYGVEDDGPGGGESRVDAGLSLAQQMEFMQKQQQLVQKLESRNVEIDRLCTLLEALEPLPGMDPEKYRRLIENPGSDLVDLRDAKIVDLAKKSRKLQTLLTKERGLHDASREKLLESQATVEKLRKELEGTMPGPGGALAADRVIRAGPGAGQDASQLEMDAKEAHAHAAAGMQRELALAHKKLEDLRRKFDHIEEQNKILSRALVKEVGDGASLEEAVDEGRKGRAQTIVMLKAKIKRLEQFASVGSVAGTLGPEGGGASAITGLTGPTMRTMGSKRSGQPDVDSQADQELEYMSSVRKVAVDELSEAHQRLSDEFAALSAKHNGAKARVRTLEAESAQHRQQLKTVIGKSETDDRLIGALKDEVARVKEAAQKAQLERRDDAMELRIQKASQSAVSVATKQQEGELNRLRRLAKQQAEQLATQDQIIRELRSKGKTF